MSLSAGQAYVNAAWSAATSNMLAWSDKDQQARANLAAFWSLKGLNYYDDPEGWDRLDLSAHKAWAALSEIGMVADNPPAQKKYADEAQQAYAGARALAQALEDDQADGALAINARGSDDWFKQAQIHGVDDSMAAALRDRVSDLGGVIEFLGSVPWWAYAAGVVGLLYLTRGR